MSQVIRCNLAGFLDGENSDDGDDNIPSGVSVTTPKRTIRKMHTMPAASSLSPQKTLNFKTMPAIPASPTTLDSPAEAVSAAEAVSMLQFAAPGEVFIAILPLLCLFVHFLGWSMRVVFHHEN